MAEKSNNNRKPVTITMSKKKIESIKIKNELFTSFLDELLTRTERSERIEGNYVRLSSSTFSFNYLPAPLLKSLKEATVTRASGEKR